MKNLKLLLAVLLSVPACCVFGQNAIEIDAGPHSTFIERGQKRSVAWNDMVDRVVNVEGLAWGAFEKGLGSHLVLPHGKVYIKGVDLHKTDLNGRLVHVTGVLKKSRIEAAPVGAQGYSKPFEYFYLDVIDISQTEKIGIDQLLPTKDDWVLPGASAEHVARLIAARKLDKYPIAITRSTDGATPHAYKVSEGLVLVYMVLRGKVTTVSNIKYSNAGEPKEQSTTLRGFKLPPLVGKIAR